MNMVLKKYNTHEVTITEAISRSAVEAGENLGAKLIACWTKTGRVTRMIRKYNPSMPIIALTDSDVTARQLALVRGVRAIVATDLDNADHFFKKAFRNSRIKCINY